MRILPLGALALAAAFAFAPDATARPADTGALAEPLPLEGVWKFHPGDDAAWASPGLDDAEWGEVRAPGSWRLQGWPEADMGWYRRTLRLDPELLDGDPPLAVRVGDVFSSYQIFAGGELLGGVGGLPPAPEMEWSRHRVYPLPASAVGDDGSLVLALRVWRWPPARPELAGVLDGPLQLGRLEDLVRRAGRAELPFLLLAALFAAVGLYHLQLFQRRPEQQSYLWFGLFALNDATFVFLRTQWRFLVSDDYVLLKEVEYLTRYLLPVLAIQFLWPFLSRPIGRLLRLYQLSHVALALAVVLEPGLELNVLTVRWWELWVLPLLAAAVVLIVRGALAGEPEARTLSLGVSVLAVAYVHDILVGRGVIDGPFLSTYGFAAFVLSMALSLSNRFSRVHRELDALRQDLEERVQRRTRELEAAKVAAEAGSRAKSEFLANMSHEIRTPMTGILGAADILAKGELSVEQRQFVEVVQSSGTALQRVLDDVLDTARIEAGKLSVESKVFELRAMVDGAVALLANGAAAKGIALSSRISDDLPREIRGDPERLRQVLLNLTANAVKFTDRGRVEIVVAAVEPAAGGDAWVRFEVRDTGIGIAPETLATLFEPFSQGDSSSSRRFGGTGLGLSISKQLIELMGGRIGVDSVEGAGSSFWFEVPAGAVQSLPPRL